MLILSSASLWIIWLVLCYRTTRWHYETILSQCPQQCCIKKVLCKHSIISRHFFSPGYLFIGVLVKICPVTILKIVLIYGRVRQVKTQFLLWLRLHVTKYMKFLIKVPNVWHSKLTWYQWRIQNDANASNLHLSDKKGQWDSGKTAHHLPSILVTLTTIGNNYYRM